MTADPGAQWRPIDERRLEQIARIVGRNSGAFKALREMKQRREAGEVVCCLIDVSRAAAAYLVGPRPTTPPDPATGTDGDVT